MKRPLFVTTFLLACILNAFSQTSNKQQFSTNKLVNTLIERIKLSGYAQGGFDYYDQSSPKDQFKIARIIFMADARIDSRTNAFVMYDFKTSALHELWFNHKFHPAFSVKVGQFKTPFSIENQLSPTVLEMIYPTSLAAGYMIGGSNNLMMKGSAGRDIGIDLHGSLLKGWLSYDIALMNGAGRNKADDNSQKDFVVRLGVHPAQWLTLSGSLLKGTGNIEVYRNEAGQIVSDLAGISGLKHNGNYRRDRYAIGAEIKTRPVNLRTEYMSGKDGNETSNAIYATGSINNIMKNIDLVASYDYLDIWSGKTNRYSAGLQYWFYPRCRVQLGYGLSDTEGLHKENCILTQIQVRF
ncbi:MAG TPA: porin [Prevotellaceae bacterium]|nr:porin [Prevotellaceae bacterium]